MKISKNKFQDIVFNTIKEGIYPEFDALTLQHGTEEKSNVISILEQGFDPGYGDMYGPGLYTIYDTNYKGKTLKGSYGDINIKFRYKYNGEKILCLDKEPAKKIYGDKWHLEDQMEMLNLKEQYNDEDMKRLLGKYKEVHSVYGGVSFTSDVAKMFVNHLGKKNIAQVLDAMIFTGRNDGNVCVVYNTDAVQMMSWKQMDVIGWQEFSRKIYQKLSDGDDKFKMGDMFMYDIQHEDELYYYFSAGITRLINTLNFEKIKSSEDLKKYSDSPQELSDYGFGRDFSKELGGFRDVIGVNDFNAEVSRLLVRAYSISYISNIMKMGRALNVLYECYGNIEGHLFDSAHAGQKYISRVYDRRVKEIEKQYGQEAADQLWYLKQAYEKERDSSSGKVHHIKNSKGTDEFLNHLISNFFYTVFEEGAKNIANKVLPLLDSIEDLHPLEEKFYNYYKALYETMGSVDNFKEDYENFIEIYQLSRRKRSTSRIESDLNLKERFKENDEKIYKKAKNTKITVEGTEEHDGRRFTSLKFHLKKDLDTDLYCTVRTSDYKSNTEGGWQKEIGDYKLPQILTKARNLSS